MNITWFLFSFNGRISRKLFWFFTAPLIVITLLPAFFIFGAGTEIADYYVNILSLVFFWPALAVQAKRWHDRDKSAWWILINCIPLIGGFWSLIENGFLPGTDGPNKYGANPISSKTNETQQAHQDRSLLLIGTLRSAPLCKTLGNKMTFLKLDFNDAPFRTGIFFGLFIGGGLLLSAFTISVLLLVLDSIGGGTGGAGGIIGFVIVPIAMIAGAPWSTWVLQSSAKYFLWGIAIGDLINGLLLGILIGVVAKVRQMLKSRNVPS